MSRPTGQAVAACAVQAVAEGYSYAQMDCQALVEFCVAQCGGQMAYAGSNGMARHVAYMATLENAKAEGRLVPGAGVMIHEDNGEPAKYQGDGLGNFSHVGLFVGEKALTDTDQRGKNRVCNVVHSGQTIGRVAGSTLKNGWTHVVWFSEIDYGVAAPTGVALGGALAEALAAEKAASQAAGQTAAQAAMQASGQAAAQETTQMPALAGETAYTSGAADSGANAPTASGNVPEDVRGFYTVRHGCKGGAVRRLQTWLAGLGYGMGGYGADGDFGAATEAAVRAFQQAQGLCADGIAGRKTWAALAAARQAASIAHGNVGVALAEDALGTDALA